MRFFKNSLPHLTLLFGVLLWAAFFHSFIPFLTFAAILLHEVGHILGAKLTGIRLSGFRLFSFEARISLYGDLIPYKKELLISFAGPLMNVLSFIVATAFGAKPFASDPLSFFATVSASLGFLNLLPIGDFDGGRILFCLLAPTIGLTKATVSCRALSFLFLFSLWCVSVYALIRAGASLSLFLFSATLFVRIFTADSSS